MLANLEGSTLLKRLKAASRLQSKVGGRISDQVERRLRRGRLSARQRAGEGPGRDVRARGQGQPRRLAHHGRHARLLRAQAVHAVQDRPRRDAAARRRRQLAPARRRREEGKRPVDRRSANTGRTRSTAGPKTWSIRRRAAPATPSRRAACPLPWCWRRFRSWKARSTCAKRRASPSRPSPRSLADDHKQQAVQALRDAERAQRPRRQARRRRFASCPTARASSPTRSACWRKVSAVMGEATDDSGSARDRRSRRSPPRPRPSSCSCNPSGSTPRAGGGGGSTPGGGGHGKTLDSALALFGGGVNDKEVREDRGVSQATGDSGPVAARRVPRRARRVLQPARKDRRRPVVPKPPLPRGERMPEGQVRERGAAVESMP